MVKPWLVLLWALAQPVDPRWCGMVKRDARGRIVRSSTVLSQFQRRYPCPSTGATVGACPGWQIDHVIPLVCGGCDSIGNLQWLPLAIKRAAGELPKDRWERRVYCASPQGTPHGV